MFLWANKSTKQLIADLRQGGTLSRMEGFTASVFQAYMPRLHAYYQGMLQSIYTAHPQLKGYYQQLMTDAGYPYPHPHPGPDPTWAARSKNMGPKSATVDHVDHANLAWGMCGLVNFGDFNPDEGGHLVLHDLGLIIRFPPGSVILLPSAMLRHSNIGIPEGQERYSMTFYSAGGLFRWVYNGFQSDKTVLKNITPELQKQREADRLKRWNDGLNMFSKLSELI